MVDFASWREPLMHGRLLAVSATNRYRQSVVVEIATRSRRDGYLPCALYIMSLQ